MKSQEIVFLGLIIIVLGVFLILAGLFKETISSDNSGKSGIRGGGVVMIGPIPIIFGTDRNSTILVIILALILIFTSYLFFWRR